MINIISGKKGRGKTKVLLEQANQCISGADGSVIFLDKDNSLMYELDRKIRLINIKEFPVVNIDGFIGFVCGILSQDHDISNIFIDGLYAISNVNIDILDDAVKQLEDISKKFMVDFTFSVSEDEQDLPPYAKQFVKISL